MSKIEFKKEQLEVLNCFDKNLIVSASAGSGKTTVMIQKIINLIVKNKQNIKNILVLTYTNASALEMKQKLISALYEQSQTNSQLLDQIDDVSTADISTLHGFFQKLIKKYFMFLNINPNFVVLDETKAQKLKSQALKNIIALYNEKQQDKLAKLINIYGKTRNEKTIFSMIEEINKFLVAIDNPYDWCLKIATQFYEKEVTQNYAYKVLNTNFFETAKHFKNKFEKLQKQCEVLNIKKYIGYCNTILSQLDMVKENLSEENFFNNCKILSNFQFDKHYKVNGYEDLLLEINNQKDTLKKFCDKIKSYNYNKENIQKSFVETKEIVLILLEITQDFQAEFSKLKSEINSLDFNDLEKFALNLLENEKIQEQIKSKYSNIFVDEYQDANRLQEKILSAISKINNRFMVGDVKQSIYGFRQAEPDIFLEMQNKFCEDINADVKFLNSNYRSHKKILDFVNQVFNVIMTEKTAKIDYKKSSCLDGQAQYLDVLGQDIPTVEINIIKKQNKQELLPPPEIYSVKNHTFFNDKQNTAQNEAFVVAKKIGELIGKKIYIPSKKSEKEVEFKDITILVSNRGAYFDDFCNVLVGFGIPIYANTKKSLYDEPEVQIFVNLLKLCKNFQNDNALAICLHSVFGGLTYNELAKIRLSSNNKKYFFECVNNYDIEDEIKSKITKFKKLIDELIFDINYQGAYFALNKLINNFDYFTFLLTKNDGNEKVAKLKKFVSDFLINEYNNDICGFLSFVEENGENINAPNFVDGENCVNITTVHSSKGLEFPIVIFVNAGSDFTKTQPNSEITINQKYGIGLKYYDQIERTKSMSIMFDALKQINKSKEFAEKIRLLYVALTRAKNHLIIVGTTETQFEKFDNEFEISTQSTYLDLIVKSLDEEDIKNINQSKQITKKDYTINIFDNNFLPEISQKRKYLFGEADKDCVKIFNNYFNFKYPNKTEIALKNSVSSLTQKVYETYTSQNHFPKTFSIAESMQTNNVDVGILYHKVLEIADFKKITKLDDISTLLINNFEEKEIMLLNKEKIFDCITLLKKFKFYKILKEQKFMMYVPHNEIIKNGANDKILIQGIIDLILLGDKNILIDYKYSLINEENKLINKYQTQLKLYKMAVEKVLDKRIDEVYLLNIYTQKLIKLTI
ncbi:MAG: UvrD-helicase domain-containing protein [Clostridia bacterium]|nr:UvrD-helicase domain-containing protein [Clostridia bacterium]